jgi:hypothetical protein
MTASCNAECQVFDNLKTLQGGFTNVGAPNGSTKLKDRVGKGLECGDEGLFILSPGGSCQRLHHLIPLCAHSDFFTHMGVEDVMWVEGNTKDLDIPMLLLL